MMQKKRVAIVTGGASGMGAASCYRLAKAGNPVAVLDIDSTNAKLVATAINDSGGRAVSVSADISQRDQVDKAVGEVHDSLGKIGVLVNCAGLEDFAPFALIESDDWDRIIDVNLKGNFNVTQSVLPDMLEQKWGRIINFSSISAQTGAPAMTHYAAAKGGIIALTRSLALELGCHGITVNAIAPGLINTQMAQRAIKGDKFPVAVEEMVKSYPIPRMGEPAEAAAAVAFFASEEASYITAQLIGVNGGTAP